MNEMSLEFWNSSRVSSRQMAPDIFIFNYKGQLDTFVFHKELIQLEVTNRRF